MGAMKRYKGTHPRDGKPVEIIDMSAENEDAGGVKRETLAASRSAAEGDSDLAELQELLGGASKADALRRAVRFALDNTGGGKK